MNEQRDDSMQHRDHQRKKVIITAVVLAAIALAFYFATFIRHWS